MARHLLVGLTLLFAACGGSKSAAAGGTNLAPALQQGQKAAVFAGGCFWCMEKPFDKLDGVLSTTSGYTGGPEEHPTYEDVGYHRTGHYEALRIVYDPTKVTYERLLEVFWHNVDPTQGNGQFCDKGNQYRTGVFTSDPEEKRVAEASKATVASELDAPIVTEILPEHPFWVAEEYHQDFYTKSPAHYSRYRLGCGRDARLLQLWGDKAGH